MKRPGFVAGLLGIALSTIVASCNRANPPAVSESQVGDGQPSPPRVEKQARFAPAANDVKLYELSVPMGYQGAITALVVDTEPPEYVFKIVDSVDGAAWTLQASPATRARYVDNIKSENIQNRRFTVYASGYSPTRMNCVLLQDFQQMPHANPVGVTEVLHAFERCLASGAGGDPQHPSYQWLRGSTLVFQFIDKREIVHP